MRVAIVDDHPLARMGISSILSENQNINHIFEASNINEALKIIETEKPNIAMVDLKLGKEDGLELVSSGKKLNPSTKFIILTSFMNQTDFLRAEKLGADGYILKEAMIEDIKYVVDLVLRGKKYYDPGIIMYCKKNSLGNDVDQLSSREKEVILELGKGLSNDQIAGNLFISVNTVKKHISSILSKLNLEHRTQVALYLKNIDL
jgi:DNA-binding NarL/FixJ family response regulator